MLQPKKRRRPAKSCEQCRSRKVKCDLEEPCGPCTRARAGLACVYSEATVRASSTSRAPLSAGDSETYQNPSKEVSSPASQQLPPIDGRLGSLADDGRRQSPLLIGEHPASARNISYLTQSLVTNRQASQPSNAVAEIPNPKSTRWASEMSERNGEKVMANNGSPTHGHSTSSTQLPRPHLRLAAEKTKFFGPAHWSHTARKVHKRPKLFILLLPRLLVLTWVAVSRIRANRLQGCRQFQRSVRH